MSEPQQLELLNLSNQQLTDLLGSLAQPPYRLRQLLDGLYRQRWSALDQFTTLPVSLRGQLVEAGHSVGLPTIEKKFTSSDGTVRYLFQFSDGQSVETVWMPEGDGGEAGDGSDSGDEELADLSPKLSSRGRVATEGSARHEYPSTEFRYHSELAYPSFQEVKHEVPRRTILDPHSLTRHSCRLHEQPFSHRSGRRPTGRDYRCCC